jgi:hypothetical protein
MKQLAASPLRSPALLGLSNTNSDWIVPAASQANGNANSYAVHNAVHTEENYSEYSKGEFAFIIHLQSTPEPPRDRRQH